MTAAPAPALLILLMRFPWLGLLPLIGIPMRAQRLLVARVGIWNVPLRPGEEL